MVELTVTGTSESGEHLLVAGPDGAEYHLRIDEDLRAALRRAAASTRRSTEPTHLSPREIQALLRSGYDVDEIADEHGLPRERVAPFEPPVTAERNFVVEQARRQRVGHDSDSPTLGDLVVDRLAARGVEVEDLAWDARRRAGESWQVGVTFVAARKERSAVWTVDLQSRTLVAVDDEARWLSETEVGSTRRPGRADGPLGATRPRGGAEPPWARDETSRARSGTDGETAVEVGAPQGTDDAEDEVTSPADLPESDTTEALLDDLAAHRGTRLDLDDLQDELDLDSLDDDTAPDTTPVDDVPAAHPPASRPDQARDAQVLSLDAHRRSRPLPGAGPDPDAPALDPRGTHPSGRGRTAPTGAGPTDARPQGAGEPGAGRTAAEAAGSGSGPEAGSGSGPDRDAEPSGTGSTETTSSASESAPDDETAATGSSAGPATGSGTTTVDDDATPSGDGSGTSDPSETGATQADAADRSDAETDDADSPAPAPRPARSSGRKQRRSVPSWDEIVFGSRSDSD
ncbi:septation protein SepH [Georgenia sp. Z1344]|uniref:septation protein SepH n=1 Tax=Georgenia sp. Z1344 TaxID=3416706 RepID=UPI003CF69355